MQIILDTNFIITSIKNKIQIFEELQKEFPSDKILIPLEVIKELEKLKEDEKLSLKEREYTKIAIELIKKYNPSIVPLNSKDVDAGILKYAKQYNNVIIATLDRNLKEKIRIVNKKVKFLTIKEKKRIVVQ